MRQTTMALSDTETKALAVLRVIAELSGGTYAGRIDGDLVCARTGLSIDEVEAVFRKLVGNEHLEVAEVTPLRKQPANEH